MDREQVLVKLAELPETAQQQVLDYIAFLHARYGVKQSDLPRAEGVLRNEPFVGIWRDRPEMQDSTQRVRESRQNDW